MYASILAPASRDSESKSSVTSFEKRELFGLAEVVALPKASTTVTAGRIALCCALGCGAWAAATERRCCIARRQFSVFPDPLSPVSCHEMSCGDVHALFTCVGLILHV